MVVKANLVGDFGDQAGVVRKQICRSLQAHRTDHFPGRLIDERLSLAVDLGNAHVNFARNAGKSFLQVG
ncbi:MAG: hypothetical protein ACE5IR_05125 [bacterium]